MWLSSLVSNETGILFLGESGTFAHAAGGGELKLQTCQIDAHGSLYDKCILFTLVFFATASSVKFG